MEIIRWILLGLICLVALALIVALFVKRDFGTEKSVLINRPLQEVYDYVKYLKNQDHFSVWSSIDPTMKKTYRGTDGTPGFVSAWDSKNPKAGKGEQEIKSMKEGERIDYELRFEKPFKSTSPAWITFAAKDSTSTEVRWGMQGRMVYPLNVVGLFADMGKMLGKDFDRGLQKLKDVLER